MRKPFLPLFRINLKSMLGLFGPMGLGGDALRSYYSHKEGFSAPAALSASLVVKFFKFLLMFAFMLVAMLLLASRPGDLSANLAFFVSALLLTLLGAFLILLMRSKRAAIFCYRLCRRLFLLRFHRQLNIQFARLSPTRTLTVLLLLLISSLFEVGAVLAALLAVGQPLPLAHVFIFSVVVHTLALATFTPQGTGFVEGGGYLVLSMSYFSLRQSVIGSFLIVWSLVRLWVPALIAAVVIWADRR